jgi:hypothetical protein
MTALHVGLDADFLDAQHGSYYLNASNMASGNLPYARMPTGSGSWDTGAGTTITITRALTVSGGPLTVGANGINVTGTSTFSGAVSMGALTATTVTASGLLAVTVGSGNAATFMGGNVGIGTTDPKGMLHLVGGNVITDTTFGLYRFYSGTTVRAMIFNPTAGITSIRATDNAVTDGILFEDYAGTDLMFVRQDGNVGIGTASPEQRLTVQKADGASGFGSKSQLRVGHSANEGVYLTGSDRNANALSFGGEFTGGDGVELFATNSWTARDTAASIIADYAGIGLQFYTNASLTAGSTFTPTERMKITTSGDVLIGTTTPATGSPRLDVVGIIPICAADSTGTGGKEGWYTARHLTAAEENLAVIGAVHSSIDGSFVRIGGGSGAGLNAVQKIEFYTAAGEITLTGTLAADLTGVGPNALLGLRGAMAMYVKSGDPATVTDAGHIYTKDVAASAEVFVRDEGGTATQVSPHDPLTGEFYHYSYNHRTRKGVRIRLERFVNAVIRELRLDPSLFVEDFYAGDELEIPVVRPPLHLMAA